jgi:hypothetical protein
VRKEGLDTAQPFVTKDGSEIRELAGTPTGNSVNQSLAEAMVVCCCAPPYSHDDTFFVE